MSIARPADGLLPAGHALALLSVLAVTPNGSTERRALADFSALRPAPRSRALNTISVLAAFGLIERDGDLLRVRSDLPPDAWGSQIAISVAELVAERVRERGARCLQSRGAGELWLDSMLLPGPHDGIPLWLIEFGVVSRAGMRDRFWRVGDQHAHRFLTAARSANRTHLPPPLSQAQLEEKLALQSRLGLEAELWVLDYEQRRLRTHPLVDQVRRVSEENVAAGYDIASFSSPHVLHHDLFVEVKSYAGQRTFFWSRNEIDTAAELGEAYALYLVDRARLDQSDYQPEVIRGPHAALFLTEAPGWEINPTTYQVVAHS